MLLKYLHLPVVAISLTDPDCWTSGFTPEICCSDGAGPQGNPDCWDGSFTAARCCERPTLDPPLRLDYLTFNRTLGYAYGMLARPNVIPFSSSSVCFRTFMTDPRLMRWQARVETDRRGQWTECLKESDCTLYAVQFVDAKDVDCGLHAFLCAPAQCPIAEVATLLAPRLLADLHGYPDHLAAWPGFSGYLAETSVIRMSGDTPCLQDREQWNDYIVMALLALLVLPPLVCTWSTWSAFLIDDRLPGVDVLRASSTIAVMAIHFGGNSAQFCPPWLHPMLWRAQDNFGVLQVVLWSRSAQHGALTVSGVGRRLFRKALRQTPACLVLYLLLHKFGFPSMHPARCYQEEVIGGAFLQCQYVQDLLAQIFPPTDHRAFTLWALGIDMQVTITLAILALVPRSVSSVVEVVVAALLWKTRFPWSHATRKASALYFDFGRYRLPMAVFVHQLERFFSDAAARYVVFRWLALVGLLAFYAAELWQGSVAIGYGPGKEIYANMIGAAYHGLVWLCLTGFIHKGGQLTLLRQVSELSFPLVIVHRHLIRLALDRLPAVRQLHKDLLKEGTLPWACVCLPPLFLASFVCALILQRCVVDPWARVAAGSKSCHFFAAVGGLLYMVAAIGYYASWKPAYEPWAKSEPGF